MKHFPMSVAAAAAGLLVLGGPAQAQQSGFRVVRPATTTTVSAVTSEVVPPPSVSSAPEPDAVTLRPGSTSTVLQGLAVRRRVPADSLRSRPVVQLETGEANLSPVFANPREPLNVAAALRRTPALAKVAADKAEVIETDKGLIVRQFLSYSIKTGTCSNPARRMQLARSGVSCFDRTADSARAAAFGNPADPHYVADPGKRAAAVQADRQASQAERADIADGIAQFRAMMADPARRAAVEAELGAAEAARLATLNDAALEEELVNAADTEIERVTFVPAREKLRMQASARPSGFALNRPQIQVPEKVEIDHALAEHMFLTGFTLGREYEWRDRVSVTIKWCVVGCKKTYYVEVYAGFDYGFGLRFPIQTGGLYSYRRVDGVESASVAAVFAPINGAPNDYSQTGLPADKLFDGKELVAEIGAYAGMNYKVPFIGSGGARADVGHDFTAGLPAPFTNGQFRPPVPGDANPPAAEIIFDNPDLIGGRANFGVVGAKVLPAVKVSLTSDMLRLTLRDNLSGIETQMTSSGQTYPLQVNPQDHSSSFSIGQPVYNLAFKVTPGLDARFFVDVSVWSKTWDWPVWFPQVAVTLPPGGANFACHAETVCSYNYKYSPTVQLSAEGDKALPSDPVEAEVQKWRNSFVKEWKPRCLYEEVKWCEVAINALAETTGNRMVSQIRNVKTFPPMNAINQIYAQNNGQAQATARGIIVDSKVRDTERYGKTLIALYEPVWNHGCADTLCRTNIHALTGPYVQALANRQKAAPNMDRNQVVFLENTQGGWAGKAQAEVEASERRAKTRIQPRLTPRLRTN